MITVPNMRRRRRVYAIAKIEVTARMDVPGTWPEGADRSSGMGAAYDYAESNAAALAGQIKALPGTHACASTSMTGVHVRNVYLCSMDEDSPCACSSCSPGAVPSGPILPTPFGPTCLGCLIRMAFRQGGS